MRKTWVGILLLFIALSPGRLVTSDTGSRAAIAHSLWTEGTVFLQKKASGLMIPTEHGFTTHFGIGQSLLLIPFDMLGVALRRVFLALGLNYPHVDSMPLVFLYAPLIGLAWCFFTHQCLLTVLDDKKLAKQSVLAMVLSTIAVVYIAQDIQEESAVGALLMIALFTGLRFSDTREKKWALLCGLSSTLCLLFRLNALFALVALFGWLADELLRKPLKKIEPKAALFFLLGTLPALTLHLVFAKWRYGGFLSSGYTILAQQMIFWHPPSLQLSLALLAGPGRGFLILSPILLFALPGLYACFRARPIACTSFVVGFAVSLFFHSQLGSFADGSESWGTRYQVHWIGLWIIFAAIGFRELASRQWARVFAAAALVVGFAFQLFASAAPSSLEYIQLISEPRYAPNQLMTGIGGGQLSRRIRNTLGSSEREPASKLVHRLSYYRPNLWGFSWTKHLRSRGQTFPWPMLAWVISVLACVYFLAPVSRIFRGRNP